MDHFGSQKRITLFDTLINDLETDEIVAVLAHEVGHYKKKHIIFNLGSSILLTGITLFILSLFINSSILSEALSISNNTGSLEQESRKVIIRQRYKHFIEENLTSI